jgi:beta-glucanase (GH16 family)
MRFIYGLWNDKKDHSFTLNNFQSTYNSSNKFHVFGFNWTENNMKWYIDGELVHTKNKGSDIPNEDWPNKSMCIVMNNGLMRVVDEGNTIFPNSLIIDYLRVYEKK